MGRTRRCVSTVVHRDGTTYRCRRRFDHLDWVVDNINDESPASWHRADPLDEVPTGDVNIRWQDVDQRATLRTRAASFERGRRWERQSLVEGLRATYRDFRERRRWEKEDREVAEAEGIEQ